MGKGIDKTKDGKTGMLIIRRLPGQSIHFIGGNATLRLISRTRTIVTFSIEDADGSNVNTITSPATEIKGKTTKSGRIPMDNGINIAILPLERPSRGVRFGIDSPAEITVLRNELLERDRKARTGPTGSLQPTAATTSTERSQA